MAYKKLLQLPNGFSAEYWRVTKIDANKIARNVEVVVSGYKDKATRDNNGKPVTSKIFTISTDLLNFNEDLFEQAYEIIKDVKDRKDFLNPNATAFFSDAQNV